MKEIIIPIFIITILILANGVFVAAEFALVTVPKTRLRTKSLAGSKVATNILVIVENPQLQNRYITTAQVGITIASLSLGMYGEHTIAIWLLPLFEIFPFFGDLLAHSIATISSVVILTYFHVVIGEMIPKSIALQSAEKTIYALYSPMVYTEKIFRLLVNLLNFLSSKVTNLMGIPEVDVSERLYSSAELEFTVEESISVGLLDDSDKVFIENIFDLDERFVEQAMTPRNHIISIPIDSVKNDVLEIICNNTKTRFPVYRGEDLDKTIGILHLKDFSRSLSIDSKDWNLENIIRPVTFVPESLPLLNLLINFRSLNHQQIAMVIDEFGGVSGIISLEDLLEEVVGEIQDEFDDESTPIQKISDNKYRVQGEVILDELNQQFNTKWTHKEALTIAGLIIATLGDIPSENQEIVIDGTILTVETIVENEIETVLITFLEN